MKSIIPLEPYILCKKLDHQSKINKLFISGQENKTSCLRRVYKVSECVRTKNILVGDIILTKQPQYLTVPVYLTEDDRVPYTSEDIVEIVDPSQIIGIYREEGVEENAANSSD